MELMGNVNSYAYSAVQMSLSITRKPPMTNIYENMSTPILNFVKGDNKEL